MSMIGSPSAAEDDVETLELAAPEDEGAMEAVFERFRTFEVSGTKAFKEEERQHLLGVIEAGFGDLEVFNSLVQSLFESLRQEHASQVEHASRLMHKSSSRNVVGLPKPPAKVLPPAARS